MSSFDDWLLSLAAANKGGAVAKIYATRGNAWSMVIQLDAAYSGSSLAGKLRLYPDAAGAELVAITCSSPSVSGSTTTFTVSLTAIQTAALPAAPLGAGVIELAYTFELTPSGGVAEVLFGGVFELQGSVT